MVWAVGLLPFLWIRPLANAIGTVVYLVDSRGRRVAQANLDAAFGDKFTPERKKQIARGSYQTFARTMLELFWSPKLNREVCAKIATYEGLDLDDCHFDKSRPVVYLCLHYSNFEWLSHFGAYMIENGPVVTQKFKNPLIGPVFDRLRGSTGNEIIKQERAMIRMLKHLKGGGKFAMLTDLNLDPSEASIIITQFGGLKTCVTQMHTALALRTGAKIVPVECRPKPDGYYRMVFHKPLDMPEGVTTQELTQRTWDILEPSVFEQPECWLWPYKHWRFKPEGDSSGRYPFYSNVAKRFDKRLKMSSS
jgi:lauroyl/myristoyl acyltransferase